MPDSNGVHRQSTHGTNNSTTPRKRKLWKIIMATNMKDAEQQGQENREEGPQEPKERPSYATVTKRNVLPVELSEADK